MTLARWRKKFMPPFHTLISDVMFSLFCLDREFDTITSCCILPGAPCRCRSAADLAAAAPADDSNLSLRTENLDLNRQWTPKNDDVVRI